MNLRHPRTVGLVALGGMLVTFGVMVATSSSGLLGAVVFAPWVAIVGVDIGIAAGIAGGAGAGGLWLIAAAADSMSPSVSQGVVRFLVLGLLFYFFEVIIVVAIQAFIFAALTAIYIGSAIEPAH